MISSMGALLWHEYENNDKCFYKRRTITKPLRLDSFKDSVLAEHACQFEQFLD